MVCRKYEWKYPPYQDNNIEKNGANHRRKNKGKYNGGQRPLEWLEVPIVLEQAWMVRPEKKKQQE